MNLLLTEEQELIQATAREFAVKEMDPLAVKTDLEGIFPEDTLKKLADLDMMGIPHPAEYGGGGADMVSYSLVLQEFARVCGSTALILAAHTMVAGPIIHFGTPEQIAKYVPLLNTYKALGAFALTEPGAGSDAGSLTTSAVMVGDEYVINGGKTFITNGDKADLLVLFVRTGPGKGSQGLSAFIVDKKQSEFTAGKHEKKMGIRGSHTTELIFQNCRVPKENLIGKVGEGFKIALHTLAKGRIGIASQAVGIIRACLEESICYAKERHQFGKPIAANQAIQWMIADMAKDATAANLLTLHAAMLCDQGKPFAQEASMAKLFAGEAAMRHAINAVQIHGGSGYLQGCKVERLFRDAKIMEIFEGTSEVHRMIIAGSLLR
ncbi:MAG: acyl-CoA dehydrogenase family protein [Negativicutes bacterium]|nr:acyl-CoA dehydrogenase family protein [Negativicutes bacterium]